jgi:pimeloyl-ACP methyl ester carboxylesterase
MVTVASRRTRQRLPTSSSHSFHQFDFGSRISNSLLGSARHRGDAQQRADYLKLFRADSIVGDCEAVRKLLVKDYPTDFRKWSIFGQSFGGFCAFTYLSKYPESLKEVFTLGGVPPIGRSPDDVYRATFRQVSVTPFEC